MGQKLVFPKLIQDHFGVHKHVKETHFEAFLSPLGTCKEQKGLHSKVRRRRWREDSRTLHGDELPRFAVAPLVGVLNSHSSVWPLKLGCGLLRFRVASQSRVMDSHDLPWPLALGRWGPALWCGPSSWG